MHAGEGKSLLLAGGLVRRWRSDYLGLLMATGPPPAEPVLSVEQQISRGLALLNRQGGKRLALPVRLQHAVKIDGAENVDVVQNEGLVGIFQEKPCRFFQTTSGIEQNSSREISMRMPKFECSFR